MPLLISHPSQCSCHSFSSTTSALSPSFATQSNEKMTRLNIFGSVKQKFNRKNSTSSRSALAPAENRSDHPLAPPPATRRPAHQTSNPFKAGPSEPPPTYSAATNASPMQTSAPTASTSAAYQATTVTGQQADDPYAFLGSFDTVFLIDDSGSMAGRSWRECSSALEAITPICTAHDADGIDIHFLNSPDKAYSHNVTAASTIHEIFSTVRPFGGTPTGQRLNQLIKPYLVQLEEAEKQQKQGGRAAQNAVTPKPMNIIVITDGVPSDDVESVLVRAAKKLDAIEAEPWQLGVQFVQVGEEWGAKEHLEGLDDDLSKLGGGCRDIVDTVPFVPGQGLTAEKILKVVLGAVNKRLDRRRNSANA